MVKSAVLGYPRIGVGRAMKKVSPSERVGSYVSQEPGASLPGNERRTFFGSDGMVC
jgi:hypothetical protein